MRKLLFVLILFITSLIVMVLLFNTFTNSSKQNNIELAPKLPHYPAAASHLAKAIQIPTTMDSLTDRHFTQFHRWVKGQYPQLFDNSNVEWQSFEQYSLVAKWIGRSSELAPIVLVANQEVMEPNLETIPEWSFNPFVGQIDSNYVYGAGAQGGKASMIALLEVFHQFVENNTLPNRTIYFAFPHNHKEGEIAIVNALKQAQIQPEMILRTGGMIGTGLLWDIESACALIGIGHQSLVEATVETKDKNAAQIIAQEVQQLNTALPAIVMEQKGLTAFMDYISPEMGFGQRMVFSNQWLLSNVQQKRFQNNPITKHAFAYNVAAKIAEVDSTNTTVATLQFSGPEPIAEMDLWIKSHLQHPQIQLLGETQVLQHRSPLAPTNNRAYRVISNTAKEIFPKLITAPILVHETSNVNWQSHLKADIYYFHPVVYDLTDWVKKQRKVDEKISQKNYQQLLQFYHQLLKNTI